MIDCIESNNFNLQKQAINVLSQIIHISYKFMVEFHSNQKPEVEEALQQSEPEQEIDAGMFTLIQWKPKENAMTVFLS